MAQGTRDREGPRGNIINVTSVHLVKKLIDHAQLEKVPSSPRASIDWLSVRACLTPLVKLCEAGPVDSLQRSSPLDHMRRISAWTVLPR